MNSYELLSEPIRKYIWEKGWQKFTPIQEAAIQKILTTNDNYILAAKTASGKTEAAFLPIISSLENNQKGVQVIYISPLIALINDQFLRIEELCQNIGISVTKWHGDASKSKKDALLKVPSGILLITPESIEAMFVNKPQNISLLFSQVKYIVVDEIHSFIGSKRGIQLQSLIYRLSKINNQIARYVALSATLGDYDQAKKFFGSFDKTRILLDKGKNEVNIQVKYYESGDGASLPPALVSNIYDLTQKHKALIFPNSRGRVEEAAVKLKRLAKRNGGDDHYFAHHSAVDKELREYIEQFAKNNKRYNFAICCTSTLELGIDIGSVDMVIQIDSTFSISSLIQRLGRSGRTTGISNLVIYSTEDWSLLQSLACYELFKSGYIEPNSKQIKNYDLVIHQILSMVKQNNSQSARQISEFIVSNPAFYDITEPEIREILSTLVDRDLLEKIENEYIVGLDGDFVVHNKNFYSVFETEDNYRVLIGNKHIGDLPLTPQVIVGANIFLAASIWKIVEIDSKSKKIFVTKASDGKKPIFLGSGGEVSRKVREKMLEILLSDCKFEYLDNESIDVLADLSQKFKAYAPINTLSRPVVCGNKSKEFFTFAETRVNRTIDLLLKANNVTGYLYKESHSCFVFESESADIGKTLNTLRLTISDLKDFLEKDIIVNPQYNVGKWGEYLDSQLKVQLLLNNFYDVDETKRFLESTTVVEI